MSSFFIAVLKMSLTASYVALIVMAIRFVLNKVKVPKIFSYALWAVVLFRLVCPISFESTLSLIPNNTDAISNNVIYSQNSEINESISTIESDIESVAINQPIDYPMQSVKDTRTINTREVVIKIATFIWMIGIIAFIFYGVIFYLRLKYRLSTSILVKDNIFETDRIYTPFVLGLIKPNIYIPTGICKNELDYILKHEQTHIRRYDHIIKPVAFFALALHWFNPLMWFSYLLMAKDMEMSCDESVMKQFNEDIRANYSNSLLSISAKQSGFLTLLGFGEGNVKSRIKNVLNYKKPAFWVSAVALIAVIIIVVSLISNGVSKDIPTMYIHTQNDKLAETIIGTYNWDFGHKKVHADAVESTKFEYAPNNMITVCKGEQMILSNDKKIPFTLESINCWDENMSEINLNPNSYTLHNGDLYINAPDKYEEYTFAVHLKYKEGYVIYGFKANVSNNTPMKGLELYIWKNKKVTGNNDTYYTLLFGTNRNKEESEIYDVNVAVNSINKLNEMLAEFSSKTEVFVSRMNTTDFTNDEIKEITDKIKFPNINKLNSIGLWEKTITLKDNTIDIEVLAINEKEIWESYVSNAIKNRKLELLYSQKYSEINLDEYLKQGKILIEGDSLEIDILKDTNIAAFLIDLDKDDIDELYLMQCEGSIRHYYVKIFKKENGVYVDTSVTDGYILPVSYKNETHFISIQNDFQTKFKSAVTEYELNGLTFKEKRIFNINYAYDVSKLPKSITKIIDNEYPNLLNEYKISNSNIAKISKTSDAPSYDVELVDKKNNNIFRFTVKLWLTTVGYAPNQWEIKSKDDSTQEFKGIDKIVTHVDEGTDEEVCFGFKFYKDEFNNVFLLKVTYPFFTTDTRKDGDLILQLFKFNKSSVDEVEKEIIEPNVKVDYILK